MSKEDLEIRFKNSNFYRLVMAYRQFAHKQANINPISLSKQVILPELQPEQFGLNLTDKVPFKGILEIQQKEGTVSEALKFLNNVYCSHIGVEFNHLEVNISQLLIF